MSRGGCCVLALAAAMLTASPAFAQIPSSELPGRERERFEQPTPALARPGGPAITLPGSVAPPVPTRSRLWLRGVRIIGGTIYRSDQLSALYQDLIGQPVTLAAVYDIAARITGPIWQRWLCPLARDHSAAGALAKRRHRHDSNCEGYVDRWNGGIAVEVPRLLRRLHCQDHRRSAGQRPHHRALSAARGDLPGLKFKNSLKASSTRQGAATLVVEVAEKHSTRSPASTIAAPRRAALPIQRQHHLQQFSSVATKPSR